MAAGGFKEFVAGEVLDEDEINDFLMQGMLVFPGTAARGSAITSPVEGQFSFLADSDSVEFYNGTAWTSLSPADLTIEFLALGGGGGGGNGDSVANRRGGGGGGAGAFMAGGIVNKTSFTVTVGAGGASGAPGAKGADSVIDSFVAVGGQGGAQFVTNAGIVVASSGGGGGGASASADTRTGGTSIPGQGNNGGNNFTIAANATRNGGGGGGAAVAGANAVAGLTGAVGGNGTASSITGSPLNYAGGGGGGAGDTGSTGGAGGLGGGGNGAGAAVVGTAGTANTGGGGGGGANTTNQAQNGGSGVVILRYPAAKTLTIPGGLTSSTSTSGSFKITSFTAGTGTVTVA